MSPASGDVRDTYEVVGKLAEGGMGAIYQARHRHLDQLRVIKVMRPQLGGDGDFEARFLREARLEAQLQHPNIAQLHEFEVTPSGAAYMVMEYIEGVSWKQALDARRRLSVGLVLQIGRQALEALAYLHERGFVHRDVSPDNLMLALEPTGEPVVKLIDLGIAKKAREAEERRITVTGTFLGKVHYASPEQFRGADVDWRSDLYSFGIVLYETLTGEFPIRGSDTNSLIAAHLFEPPRPFSEVDPEGRVPEELRQIVLRAMAKDREERFPSTRDFALALAALQPDHPADPEELPPILEAARRDPVPLREGEALSILGTAPVSGSSPTVAIAGEGAPPTLLIPERQDWPTRLFGPPGRRLLRGALAALVVAGAVTGGALLAPSFGPAPDTTEAPSPATLRSADTALIASGELGRSHALVVGNDAYVDPALPRLETAVRDARAVGSLLRDEYGFDVTLLENATRADLFDALADLRERVAPTDSVLLYYAGHGTVVADSPYWQLVDATATNTPQWVASADLDYELQTMPARHVLVVADSCYSGAVEEQVVDPAAPPARSGDAWAEYVRTGLERRSRLALSSGGFQEVADRGAGGRHSPFARELLRLLEENGRILDGSTLHRELARRVEREATELGLEQHPVFTALPGDEDGAFFFVPAALLGRST